MAIENLISLTLSDEEKTTLLTHLKEIEQILSGKCISLTPDQRREYGRLGNRTENWSDKVMTYMDTQPTFNPAFIDVEETKRDHTARKELKPIMQQLESLTNMVDDTLMVLGADLYNSHVAYYRNVKLLARQNVNGAKAIYDDLSTQFPGRGRSSKSSAE